MSDNANRWRSGAFLRRLVPLPVVVLAVGLAFAGTASAQTAFQANVKGTGSVHDTCLVDQTETDICGTADIAGYGTGSWGLLPTSLNFVPSSCDSTYTATDEFTVGNSTLTLNERGYGCGPGKNGNGFFMGADHKRQGPNVLHGTWTVDTAASTGQFAGLSGSGTDLLKSAGAHNLGSYIGTLG